MQEHESNIILNTLWAAVWYVHVSLVLIGLIALIGFVRLNFSEDELSVNFDVVTDAAVKKK